MAHEDLREDDRIQIGQVNGGDRKYKVESLLKKLNNTFDFLEKMWGVSKNVCIYRVPEAVRNSKPEDYVPTVVSLGPYHHNITAQFSKIDQHKLEAVHIVSIRHKKDVSTLIAELS
ncbi:hypothetical protein SUGI_0693480 [Cryptomeria japonica]|nr:hypothetical protein SUGI_0693480 [Cryptomeria japonica]